MPVMQTLDKGAPVKIWTDEIDAKAMTQLGQMSQMPFIYPYIAVMPDVHWGLGATIGSVIPSRGAIIPAAVGVDLGCGMQAVCTSLSAERLPDNLHALRSAIEAAVPHGRTDNGGRNDVGAWRQLPDAVAERWKSLVASYERIIAKHPKAKGLNSGNHLGTLGTGNHFIELCLDERDRLWVMLHSGSRGAGNRIGTYFIECAKQEMERHHKGEHLPDRDLAYLSEHTRIFDDYCEAVAWAQDFAAENRKAMMAAILWVLRKHFGEFGLVQEVVDCHHNYIARERHFGEELWVTRKGAIRARRGDLGIIPGSMGARSYIVCGKGSKESFCSCSHGAGRKLGRNEARRKYTAADLTEQTQGIECPKDSARVDEIPAAYKSIETVMHNQSDLVEVLHILHQIVNVKG